MAVVPYGVKMEENIERAMMTAVVKSTTAI
jgi:hypothetical protein